MVHLHLSNRKMQRQAINLFGHKNHAATHWRQQRAGVREMAAQKRRKMAAMQRGSAAKGLHLT